jgi:hypothetical protein
MDKILYSLGNKKIGKDTMIINLSSATDCISKRLGLCQHPNKCYAMKAERLYPQVLPFRRKQEKIFNTLSAFEIAKQIIEINKKKRNKIKYLRINESGDFRNQLDIKKVNLIAMLLKKEGIKVYTYTHRKDLNFDNLSDNLTINSSYKDKKISNRFIALAEKKYNKVNSIKKDKKIVNCKMDCTNCNLCKVSNNLTILCKMH